MTPKTVYALAGAAFALLASIGAASAVAAGGPGGGSSNGGDSNMPDYPVATACTKPQALDLAASFGISKRSIRDVNENRVVVHGQLNGQHVELILRSNSDSCAVQRMSYL